MFCHDIGLSGRSGEVQGIEEIELLQFFFAGVVEGAVADMSGFFWIREIILIAVRGPALCSLAFWRIRKILDII